MLVWLCKYGETIPIYNTDRKYRVGMLGESLKRSNCDVIWWASDFDHGKKKKIDIPKKTYSGIQLKKLSGRSYKKNISLQRILHNYEIGQEFSQKVSLEEIPDVIYTSMPTIDMAYRATKYAKLHNVLLVVDIRDLWPDVFKTLMPIKALRKDIFFKSMNNKLKFILNNADLVIAPTIEYIDWAKKKKGVYLKKTSVVPFGYEKPKLPPYQLLRESRKKSFEITFAGTVSVNFDLETVLKAAEVLSEDGIFFNIVGSGDRELYLKEKYGHLNNVKFWGWCNADQLHKILKRSTLGIAPYIPHENFIYNIPNKPYEYMAYGLPILTCLKGATYNLLDSFDMGLFYEYGDHTSLKEVIKGYLEKTNLSSRENESLRILDIFEENFSAEVVYAKLVKSIEECVKHEKIN